MATKQSLKQGEKILFAISVIFVIVAVIAYVAMETYRIRSPKPLFESKTSFELSPLGHKGSALFRLSGCTACHRAMRNGTNMGLSLDGVGSRRTHDWLNNFLHNPEEYYAAVTIDHGQPPKEAAYVASMSDEDLLALSTFISELKAEQGSVSAWMPPEGHSEFIDSMVGAFAPKEWKEKYRDVRDLRDEEKIPQQGEMK